MADRFEEMLEQHRASVFRYAFSLTRHFDLADDLTQDCMLLACRTPSRPDDLDSVKGWLLRITRNRWIDLCRKRKEIEFSKQECEALASSVVDDPAESAMQRERVVKIMGDMLALPTRQREVMYLRVIEQLRTDEIAETLQTTKANVKASLSVARRTLRQKIALTNDMPESPDSSHTNSVSKSHSIDETISS